MFQSVQNFKFIIKIVCFIINIFLNYLLFIGTVNYISTDKNYICYTNPNLSGSSGASIFKYDSIK